jgi:hypothetical protein
MAGGSGSAPKQGGQPRANSATQNPLRKTLDQIGAALASIAGKNSRKVTSQAVLSPTMGISGVSANQFGLVTLVVGGLALFLVFGKGK